MIYGYLRVSTDKQTLENQRFEIDNFLKEQNLKVDKWIKEKVSGTKHFQERRLGKLINSMKKGDILVSSEMSRFGRSLFQIMSILHICMLKEVQVWTIKDNYRLGVDIKSKVLAFAFSLSAEIERNLISQRTKEALSRIKADGKSIGRQYGSLNKHRIWEGKEAKIALLLSQGVPKVHVARMTKMSLSTLYKNKNAINKCLPKEYI